VANVLNYSKSKRNADRVGTFSFPISSSLCVCVWVEYSGTNVALYA